ncbi:hypothetical protein AVEN_49432-1 [Araneus ventricosus]|uniref:Uncharacterized protein n=1 Tax=Araneus ventricosus TaxID=182803 RepID=A0A4Y2CNQ0_ARAVE|nr:hypothetical protein AVEN_49432-1 [Araneus ventricosus]
MDARRGGPAKAEGDHRLAKECHGGKGDCSWPIKLVFLGGPGEVREQEGYWAVDGRSQYIRIVGEPIRAHPLWWVEARWESVLAGTAKGVFLIY